MVILEVGVFDAYLAYYSLGYFGPEKQLYSSSCYIVSGMLIPLTTFLGGGCWLVDFFTYVNYISYVYGFSTPYTQLFYYII